MTNSELIQAISTALTLLGSAVAFIWGKIEWSMRKIRNEQKRQAHHLRLCQEAREIKLRVIELLWSAVKRYAPEDTTLGRAKELLDDVKRLDREAHEEVDVADAA